MSSVFSYIILGDLFSELEKLSKVDHSVYDSFVLAILSHGVDDLPYAAEKIYSLTEKGMFLTSDSIVIHYNTILNFFIPSKCPTLNNKPKFFIFDCCRGTRGLQVLPSNFPISIPKDSSRTPVYFDFLLSYSTAFGDPTFVYSDIGSIFIRSLCEIFSENARNFDVPQLLTLVAESCYNTSSEFGYAQIPQFTNLLRKFYRMIPFDFSKLYKAKSTPLTAFCTLHPSCKADPYNLHWPNAIQCYGDHIIIADGGNRRVAFLPLKEFIRSHLVTI